MQVEFKVRIYKWQINLLLTFLGRDMLLKIVSSSKRKIVLNFSFREIIFLSISAQLALLIGQRARSEALVRGNRT